MKYILQKILKTKAKDLMTLSSMQAAKDHALNVGLRYEGTSYIGVWPQFTDHDHKLYRIILRHPLGLVCSPSKEDLSVFDQIKA